MKPALILVRSCSEKTKSNNFNEKGEPRFFSLGFFVYIYSGNKIKESMETNEKIIESLKETINKIKEVEAEFIQKKADLEQEIEDKKSNVLSALGFRIGDQVTLEIYEYRDDRIHCFAVPQIAECFIHGVVLKTDEKKQSFLAPILKKKDRKRNIYHNDYLNWDLKKDGKVILSHRAEQHIIPDTYTEKQLVEYRTRLLSAQKI